MPALGLGTYYRATSPSLSAGGDLVDVVDFDDGRWGLLIGDVCGKGPEAAAVTGEIRHMLRALARVETQPSALLAMLNDALISESLDERFCTVCCVRIDTTRHPLEVTVASGGHPLPLLRRADGTVAPVGSPVEQRGRSLTVGEQALTRAFEHAPQPDASGIVEHLRRAVEDHHPTLDDDIALLLA